MGGYIKLYRKIREHWVWDNPDHLKRWLDLLLMVNHKPVKIQINGSFREVGVGEHHTSKAKLATRWAMDRKTVDRFLELLEKDGMISIKSSRQSGTTIKVLNYMDYQAFFDGTVDNETDIESASKAHKQEPEEPKNIDMSKDISLADYRQRYTSDQLKTIDEFFGVLKHTRKSAKLADGVILKIYQSWEKYETQKVIYALNKYIHTPTLHDKKESYVLGIIRNTSAEDAGKIGTSKGKPKKNTSYDLEAFEDALISGEIIKTTDE